ncbi:LysR family transcriptional regulator [Pseudomonas sp. NPDC087342]|uniref:LysR family transcriptional regulator n=1 Tax=Pseudomonas sp. NPDC087342 TaxID=3364437 RepID=UPI0037FB4710
MDKLGAIQVFVTVVERGSMSAAADKLGLSRQVVSRYLAELEAWAGVRLMHRTTRKLSVTPAGMDLLPRCHQILDLTGDIQSSLAARPATPSGLLRVTVSTSFGQVHLAPAIVEYLRLYPQVEIDIVSADRTVNLIDERIDLALRISNELDPNLIARELARCRSVICASPAYLAEHGTPQDIQDLREHNCLSHFYFGKNIWHFEHHGETVSVPVSGNIRGNETSTLMQATLAGGGIAMLPRYLAAPAIQSGKLVEVLNEYLAPSARLYAVYASRKNMPTSLRTLLDFLAERFQRNPDWESAPSAS